jgi:heme-degrading monooxygenase HmoA
MAQLAQVNVSLQRAPMRHRTMAGFVTAFDPVARLAAESPGFVWHHRSDSGHTVLDEERRPQVVNLTVWRDYRSLHEFVYRSAHGRLLLRRTEWFLPTPQPSTALWWVPDGERPTVEQALARLRHLREHGPTPQAFSLRRRFTPEGQPDESWSSSGSAASASRTTRSASPEP